MIWLLWWLLLLLLLFQLLSKEIWEWRENWWITTRVSNSLPSFVCSFLTTFVKICYHSYSNNLVFELFYYKLIFNSLSQYVARWVFSSNQLKRPQFFKACSWHTRFNILVSRNIKHTKQFAFWKCCEWLLSLNKSIIKVCPGVKHWDHYKIYPFLSHHLNLFESKWTLHNLECEWTVFPWEDES